MAGRSPMARTPGLRADRGHIRPQAYTLDAGVYRSRGRVLLHGVGSTGDGRGAHTPRSPRTGMMDVGAGRRGVAPSSPYWERSRSS